MRAEINEESLSLTPLINQYAAGKELSDSDLQKINNLGIKMRPITYTMLQTIIEEPKMSYDEVTMMMEILDDVDCDTLLSYVSLMTSEKASVMKRIYDKRMQEAEIITQ